MGVRGMVSLRERRELLAGAVRAFEGLGGRLWEAGGGELAELLGELDEVVRAGEAARVVVVAEALERGEPGSGERALSAVDWVLEHAPSLRAGGAAQVVRLAQVFAVPGNGPVKEAVVSGRLPVRSAAVVVSEVERMRPLLVPGAEDAVLEGLVTMAAEHGPRGCRSLRSALLARYGLEDVLDRDQEAARRYVALSQPRVGELELAEYRLVLDPEGRAVLEAALGPLSAPVPVQGEPDLRPAEQRRGEALVTLARRAVAAAESVPVSPKAQLVVTVDLEVLGSRLGGSSSGSRSVTGPSPGPAESGRPSSGPVEAEPPSGPVTGEPRWSGSVVAGVVAGGPQRGLLLAPAVVRRLACDAAVIPAVLGSDGEVVDLGRAVRLFTPGQLRRLWLRDAGCTFPGCSMPEHWCDAHHLVHWADGGRTVLDNAALLCGRHHTVVHQRRLAGARTGGTVVWDLGYGSYDRELAGLAAREPA